jgi:hypothetical protein
LKILILAVFVLGSAPAWLGADPALDTLTLKDGSVVQGQIVDETASAVGVVVNGVRRSFARDFIVKIDYAQNPGSTAPASPPAQSNPGLEPAPGVPGDAWAQELSAEYQVPESTVLWVNQQGIAQPDVPEVFEVAASARAPLGDVVQLRRSGESWPEIRAHYGLQDAPPPPPHAVVVVEPAPAVVVAAPLLLRILFFPFFLFMHHH